MESGLRYIIREAGKGDQPKRGARATIHYTGELLFDSRKFDNSRDRKAPFNVELGAGRVVKVWEEAILDMRRGELRTIIVPPELEFGERGFGSQLPPNSHLVYEI